MTMTEPSTPLQALAQALRRAQRFNQDVECAPHCILWPDKDAQWRPIIGALQAELPELLVLGPLDEAHRTGPGIWLRCAMAGQVPAIQLDGKHPPILYLPGVGRQDLRAIEHCPESLRSLAELQYRGQMFSQVNAKDWTVLAFLKSEQGGLGLDVGQDKESKESMLLALGQIMNQPLEVLRARRLDGAWFNTLLTGGDPDRHPVLCRCQGRPVEGDPGLMLRPNAASGRPHGTISMVKPADCRGTPSDSGYMSGYRAAFG